MRYSQGSTQRQRTLNVRSVEMITKHSIDLRKVNDPCFAITPFKSCRVFGQLRKECGTYKCSFYKPKGCKDWIRITDRTGTNLIPPEDVFIGGKDEQRQRD